MWKNNYWKTIKNTGARSHLYSDSILGKKAGFKGSFKHDQGGRGWQMQLMGTMFQMASAATDKICFLSLIRQHCLMDELEHANSAQLGQTEAMENSQVLCHEGLLHCASHKWKMYGTGKNNNCIML